MADSHKLALDAPWLTPIVAQDSEYKSANHTTITEYIDKNFVGLIIGSGAKNLQRIEKETGARIQFVDDSLTPFNARSLRISAPQSDPIDQARYEIFALINENEEKWSCCNCFEGYCHLNSSECFACGHRWCPFCARGQGEYIVQEWEELRDVIHKEYVINKKSVEEVLAIVLEECKRRGYNRGEEIDSGALKEKIDDWGYSGMREQDGLLQPDNDEFDQETSSPTPQIELGRSPYPPKITFEGKADQLTQANFDYLGQLTMFHKKYETNLNRFPSFNKRPLDLYKLKKAVEVRGGFEKVCKLKKWAEIGRDLGYSGKIMSSLSTSLENSYQRWLHPYEEYLRTEKPGVQQDLATSTSLSTRQSPKIFLSRTLSQDVTSTDQEPKLFIARTISQDLSGNDASDNKHLLCALRDRPSGLKFSSKRLFREEIGSGVGKKRRI